MKRPDSYTSQTVERRGIPRPEPVEGPGGRVRSRAWERQPENKKYSYRIGQDLNELLKQEVAELKDEGFKTTVSDMARAWLQAGYQAWIDGNVDVEGTWLTSGTARRTD